MIPSNFTLEEFLKYSNINSELDNKFQELINELKAQVEKKADKIEEQLREEIYFRDEFIQSTLQYCNTITKCEDLVSAIKREFENSDIEL